MNIRIAGIVNESVVDGPGIRMVIFTQGCPHHCPGCHNPETHDFEGGHLEDTEDLIKKIKQKVGTLDMETNCYLIIDEETKRAMVVDPIKDINKITN